MTHFPNTVASDCWVLPPLVYANTLPDKPPSCELGSYSTLLSLNTLLQFKIHSTGILVLRTHQPIAWILCGHHRGQLNQQPHTCHFVDVVYYRRTQRGENLETADFQTLNEALTFVCSTLGGRV